MKGVLLRRAPAARLVDLSHAIPPQDVLTAAFVLLHAAREFPPETVHLAVVDPGVGTRRRAVAMRTRWGIFVAPDNGLLGLVAAHTPSETRVIDSPELRADRLSPTFAGRDLFACAAGSLAAGFAFAAVGPLVAGVQPAPVPPPSRQAWAVCGQVIVVDHFGNLVTNIGAADLPGPRDRLVVRASAAPELRGVLRTYSDVASGEALALVGSAGLLEIAVRDGSAAARLGLARGAPVHVFHV